MLKFTNPVNHLNCDDRLNVVLQEMKARFVEEAQQTGQPQLLLTTAVGAGKETIDAGYEIPELCACVTLYL